MRTYQQQSDTKQLRRMRSEDRFLTKLERLEKQAFPLIGELCREGKTVYYVNCLPLHSGKTRESLCQYELVEFLIRNKYVR